MTTAIQFRRAILECATSATTAEPRNTEARLHSFIAKLSATMDGLGEPEVDKALWALFESRPAAAPATVQSVH
jgi:hypothetical protein